jgi:geranylgeranyl reductase family protein
MGARGVVTAQVVVVGAGPAGCSAAALLAAEGLDVALLDQGRFPREKVCGDGLTPRCSAMLEEMGLAGLAGRAVQASDAYVVAPNGEAATLVVGRAGAALRRAELDAALVEHAGACGARLFLGAKAVGIVQREDGVLVETGDGGGFAAAWAVLSTGAGIQGLMAAGLGRPAAPAAVGRRAYFAGVEFPPRTVAFCYERDLLPGYGWVFGLGDGTANVGVMTFPRRGRRAGRSLSAAFEAFVSGSAAGKRFLARATQVGPAHSAPLRLGFAGGRLGAGRLLAAGDAAAGANPLTGEGVYAALGTGRLAARSIVAALREGRSPAQTLAGYRAAVGRAFARDYGHARLVRRLMACPAVVNRLVRAGARHPELADPLVRVIVEGASPLGLLSPGRLAKLLL